jgi:hypothetical protein
VNRGLRTLLWWDGIGRARSFRARLRTPRGIVGMLGVGIFLLVLGSARIAAWISPDVASPLALGEQGMRQWGPLALLVFIGMNFLSGRGLYFKPAEIGLLFAAPLSRRDLVAYNVLARARLALLSAVWMAVVFDVGTSHWSAVLVGMFLALLFVQLGSQLLCVGSAWLSEHLRPARRASVLSAFAVVLVASVVVPAWLASRDGLGASAAAAAGGPLLAALTAPARPALEVMLAPDLATALGWSALALGVVWLLFEATARLDVAYAEIAHSGSRALRRSRTLMHTGGGAMRSREIERRRSLPRFPRLAGAGPLAWRQCLELARNPRGVISILLVMAVTILLAVLMPVFGEPDVAELAARVGLGVVVLMSLVLTQNFAFDFRRDIDRMALLKSLPISGAALASGQLVAATLFTTTLQLSGLGLIASTTGAFSWQAVLALALPLPALSWATATVDNAIFLTWPYRMVPEDPGDMGFMGRNMLITTVKVAVVSSLAIGSAFAAGLVVRAVGGGVLVAGTSAALAIGLTCVPLTWVVARAFARLDVSSDVPC